MTPRTLRELISGPAGRIECALDRPAGAPLGLAVVCHPHPQGGGTLDNKVSVTIARACIEVGWASVRFNFRGVGASEGAWDEGVGEVDDALAVIAEWRRRDEFDGRPLVLGGFSFGGYVAVEAATRLAGEAKPRRIVLVGPSTEKQAVRTVPPDTVVVHGESDELVPLAATLAWARPQGLPVIVFPGVGHFFHGQIALLKRVLVRELRDLSVS
ncbi:MAG: alpha/beta fold hydrolase [Rhizobacter sp.]|nr:alpha/beta fold hydrolase [Rhizobacter sp.]